MTQIADVPDTVVHRVDQLCQVHQLLGLMAPHEGYRPNTRRFFCLEAVADVVQGYADHPDGPARRRNIRAEVAAAADALPPDQRLIVLRALAILHWEWALACDDSPEDARGCHELADHVWRHLLPNPVFWDVFAREHDVPGDHLDDVRSNIIEHILRYHLEEAKECYRVGDQDGCSFHAQRLESWTDPPAPLSEVPPADQGDETMAVARSIQSRANGMFNAWLSEFLHRGSEQLREPEAIERLGGTLSHDFEGAINIIRKPLEVFPENLRLLKFTVVQYTELAHELALAEKYDEARQAVAEGCTLAQRLAELHLKPGDSVHPDNQAVCLILQLAYNLETDSEKEMRYLEQCQHWGGKTEQIEFQITRQRARQALDENLYTEALQVLDTLDPADAQRRDIVQLRTAAYFRRGISAVEEAQTMAVELASRPREFFNALRDPGAAHAEKGLAAVEDGYRRGMGDLQRAAELEPNMDVIRKNIEAVNELLDEGRFHLILRASHQVLEDDISACYEDVAAVATMVPHDCELGQVAKSLSVAALLRLGVDAANDRRFEQSEQWFERAIELEPEQEIVAGQFAQLYVVWAQSLVVACREPFESLETRPGEMLKAAGSGFRAIGGKIKSHQARMNKLLARARSIAPAGTAAEIDEAIAHMPDLADIQVNSLMAGAAKALEDDQSEYYLGFAEALLKVADNGRTGGAARHMAAACYFRLGIRTANEDKLQQAVAYLDEARKLDPDTELIQEQYELVGRMAREEPMISDFRQAQKAFEKNDFDTAMRLCKHIPSGFSHAGEVREFMALICNRLQDQAMKKEDLKTAMRYARQAVEYSPGEKALKENIKQLEQFEKSGGFRRQQTITRHNKGIEKANMVVKTLDTLSTGFGGVQLTPEMGRMLLAQLEEAVEMTDYDPGVVQLRDQLRDAMRR